MHWHAPGRKRPIAFSTVATSRLLGLLAEEGHTFDTARTALRFDREGQAVVDEYIARGFSGTPMAELNVRY